MEIRKITLKDVIALQRSLGFGATILDLDDVDIEAGRGIISDGPTTFKHCLWTHRGNRITITFCNCPEGPAVIASQDKEPDPEYPNAEAV